MMTLKAKIASLLIVLFGIGWVLSYEHTSTSSTDSVYAAITDIYDRRTIYLDFIGQFCILFVQAFLRGLTGTGHGLQQLFALLRYPSTANLVDLFTLGAETCHGVWNKLLSTVDMMKIILPFVHKILGRFFGEHAGVGILIGTLLILCHGIVTWAASLVVATSRSIRAFIHVGWHFVLRPLLYLGHWLVRKLMSTIKG